ncbi:class I SAM-dependent methyltransferase [Pararoseomonas indoligenes]|uniref:Class I SAM-dependent methyltransferase n=1 Tax=Roseomonas indoligenes TaxID=2820811 RepID=A0A940N4Q7_9PROT|nr:class I SAM-dependent methyltransferase [Pararoseomonas indoligenes]MBP0494152.1 class I SAM-dependent methyltransferase [Pararoseomonas indoligenes]
MTERNGADSVALAYDGWAPIYDLVFGPVFREGRRVATQAAERVGGRILEVGVGTGLSLAGYRRENTIFGMDISAPMLWKARGRVERQGLGHVGGLAVMDAERLAFGDDSFDVIVAQYVVTAVPNPERALDEFLRVVRPGGEIIIATRVGAESGLRGTIERALMPVTSRLGWRTEFPWSRYADWVAGAAGAKLLERRPLPPLGHFSLVRITKDARSAKATSSMAASTGGGPVAQRMASSPHKES